MELIPSMLTLAIAVTYCWIFMHATTWLRDIRRLLTGKRSQLFRESLERDRRLATWLAIWAVIGAAVYAHLCWLLWVTA